MSEFTLPLYRWNELAQSERDARMHRVATSRRMFDPELREGVLEIVEDVRRNGDEAVLRATEKFDGVCFYASVLTSDTGDVGDFGFCTPSCNCTDDCNDSTLACQLLSQGALSSDFRGAGLCFAPDATTKEYNQCTDTGAGGSGAGGAGSDAAGAPGAGGNP